MSLRTGELHAVVLGRIMRGRDHHAAVEAELSDREVERVGRNHSDVDDVGAGFGCAAGERFAEFLPRRAHVAADDDVRASLA